jgi:hypothetical protein
MEVQPANLYARSRPGVSFRPVGRAVHITAFVARFVSLQFSALHGGATRLTSSLGNGFLSRLVGIAEISL